MDRPVRVSAKGLVIRGGRMAAVKLRDKDGEFFIMPGGGMEGGELLPEAVEREIAEETGIRVKCGDMLFAIEGQKGENFHRIDLVFECEYIGETENSQLHGDTNQVGMEWLEIERLNLLPLYPSKLRRPIMNFFAGRPQRTYLGNENMGDPEIME